MSILQLGFGWKRPSLWVLGVAALMAGFPAHALRAQAPLTAELATEDYPPLMAENLPYGGILTRVVVEAFRKAGMAVKLRWVPNNRAIVGVMDGLYDGSYGWAHSPERDKYLLYSTSTIYNLRMTFFQRRGEDYPWKQLEDLGAFRIGATIGNHYSDEFSALQAAGKLKVEEAASDAFSMKKLAKGRIDLFPMEQESGQVLADLTLTREERGRITFQSNAIWEVPVYVVIGHSRPRAQELVARFDKGYRALEASGQLKTLIEQTRQAIQKQGLPR